MNISLLQPLGWSNYFTQEYYLNYQQNESEKSVTALFRITAIHRDRIEAFGEFGSASLISPSTMQPVSEHLAVGDWVVAQQANEKYRICYILQAKNRISRQGKQGKQLIAANLDYLWIVTSANDEFNYKRLQRYLALAYDNQIEPMIILTKVDLCADIDIYLTQLEQLNVQFYFPVCAQSMQDLAPLKSYCTAGTSIALVGSSGVGKSTLTNLLLGNDMQHTQTIREQDCKGKHTTTYRQLRYSSDNLAVIDTPGMRELLLDNAEAGIEMVFADIADLAINCKFNDCSHQQEPGCKVIDALQKGELAQSHYDNYQKLLKEYAFQKRKELGSHAVNDHYRKFYKMINSMHKETW